MDKSQELLEEAIKAVEKCYWRRNLAGVSICSGVCLPCQMAINSGRCDALNKLHERLRKESDNNEK